MISYEDLQQICLLEMEDDILNAINTFDSNNDNTDIKRPRLRGDTDYPNKANKIVRPQGIIIEDTWNNCVFPIQPHPQIDTSRFDLHIVMKRFRELYLNFPSDFLPWHYVVEMIGPRYYIFQTRPLDAKYPLTNQEILDATHSFKDETTIKFFEDKIYQINNMIHICLIGDSNVDIYPDKLYRLIGRTCVRPMYWDSRIKGGIESTLIGLNIGKKFSTAKLIRGARK